MQAFKERETIEGALVQFYKAHALIDGDKIETTPINHSQYNKTWPIISKDKYVFSIEENQKNLSIPFFQGLIFCCGVNEKILLEKVFPVLKSDECPNCEIIFPTDAPSQKTVEYLKNNFTWVCEWAGMYFPLKEKGIPSIIKQELSFKTIQQDCDAYEWAKLILHSFYRGGLTEEQEQKQQIFLNKLINMNKLGSLLSFVGVNNEDNRIACALSVLQKVTNKCAFVFVVCTHNDYRRRGYASSLMTYLMKMIKNNPKEVFGVHEDVDYLCLHGEPLGRPVYVKLGFEQSFTFECFESKTTH
ncbi:hypothetical protein ABK040_000666 [Willaertia magna]